MGVRGLCPLLGMRASLFNWSGQVSNILKGKVGQISCGTYVTFYNKWHKCHLLAIGGTNVTVALMSGGTCVSGRNDSGTYDGRTKVAPPSAVADFICIIRPVSHTM